MVNWLSYVNEQSHLSKTLKDKQIDPDEDREKSKLQKTNRTIACFLQGLINMIADLLCGKGISLNGLVSHLSFAVNTS